MDLSLNLKVLGCFISIILKVKSKEIIPTTFLQLNILMCFSLVWHEANTWGSDGHWGVKIYKMIPSPGYTCLGHIAVNRWDYAPQDVSDRYRYFILGFFM